jgi:hypothetical protein
VKVAVLFGVLLPLHEVSSADANNASRMSHTENLFVCTQEFLIDKRLLL